MREFAYVRFSVSPMERYKLAIELDKLGDDFRSHGSSWDVEEINRRQVYVIQGKLKTESLTFLKLSNGYLYGKMEQL